MLYNIYNITDSWFTKPINNKPIPKKHIDTNIKALTWLYAKEHNTTVVSNRITKLTMFDDMTIETMERTIKYADNTIEVYTIEFAG